jgi:hypothetical protein
MFVSPGVCGYRGRANSRAVHSGGDPAPLALDDGHWPAVSSVHLVGAICGAARNCRVALLATAAACVLGTCRKFLRRAWAAGEDVVRRDTVALWPDPKQRKR